MVAPFRLQARTLAQRRSSSSEFSSLARTNATILQSRDQRMCRQTGSEIAKKPKPDGSNGIADDSDAAQRSRQCHT
jgi:hypothetical protein